MKIFPAAAAREKLSRRDDKDAQNQRFLQKEA
jgi:hypothetical protein